MIDIPQNYERQIQTEQIIKEFESDRRGGRDGVTLPSGIRRVQSVKYLERFENGFFNYDCIAFAFGIIKREPWIDLQKHSAEDRWDPIVKTIENLLRDPEFFLTERGYEVVNGNPQEGDIVAYGNVQSHPLNRIRSWRNQPIGLEEGGRDVFHAKHFGVYMGDEVVSKFGRNDIYAHDIGVVPSGYGDKAMIFRKHEREIDAVQTPSRTSRPL